MRGLRENFLLRIEFPRLLRGDFPLARRGFFRSSSTFISFNFFAPKIIASSDKALTPLPSMLAMAFSAELVCGPIFIKSPFRASNSKIIP
ncbi:MAG: hypothetical protein ACREUY_01155 [Burkholderiales bacterium]